MSFKEEIFRNKGVVILQNIQGFMWDEDTVNLQCICRLKTYIWTMAWILDNSSSDWKPNSFVHIVAPPVVFRVQHDNARGPMKGGIRYHPSYLVDSKRDQWSEFTTNPTGKVIHGALPLPLAESSRRISMRRRHLELMGALIVIYDDVGCSSDNKTQRRMHNQNRKL